ncbi:MAG: DNA replication/repair protein RecF [Microthrixaceae bacterium]
MRIRRIWLSDFRSYEELELELPPGLTVLVGDNGRGKTNLVEAVSYLSTLRSFRGAPTEALVRVGSPRAVVRAEVEHDGREALVEAEVVQGGRGRVLVNRQRLGRTRDLLGVVRTTVFAPDDLELVKGGPAGRRDLLDDAVVALRPSDDLVRSEWERALRQRNALLKQVHGRLDEAAALTLEVWDDKAARAGERLTELRAGLVDRLTPLARQAYGELSGEDTTLQLELRSPWREDGLAAALARHRPDDLRRGVTTVGPHRDELHLDLDRMPVRTHASQGEQRCCALALRLAIHRLLAEEFGEPPVLLLDDVLSELDPDRAAALLRSLPPGQTLLTTAVGVPAGVEPELVVTVGTGTSGTVVTAPGR